MGNLFLLQLNVAFVVRHHVVDSSDPDDLQRHLLQLCTYHIEVLALSSGRSGAVSGEVLSLCTFLKP